MFVRALSFAVALTSFGALAQNAIGGAVTASFEGYQGGAPVVRYDVALSCSLMCPPSMPLLTYSIKGNMETVFDKVPTENTGLTNAVDPLDIKSDGASTATTTMVRPGTVSVLIARDVTCECGLMTNQGGLITLTSAPFAVPPNLVVPDTVRAKSMITISLTGEPRGSDVVKVIMSGAGIDEVVNLGEFDFPGKGAVLLRTPTNTGTFTVTASLLGATVTRTVTVTAATNTDAGVHMNTGGGGGGNTMPTEPLGCSAVPGSAWWLVSLLGLGLRRRRAE